MKGEEKDLVVVGRIEGREGREFVMVRCPYCGYRHAHGRITPSAEPLDQNHRIADCSPGGGYFVVMQAQERSVEA